MATTYSPGTGIEFRIVQPKSFHPIPGTPGMLTRFEEEGGLTEDNITPEEYREFVVLKDFLTHHIKTDGFHDVQCMLLWSEWVRVFQRQTHRFPEVVLEKEFRNVIINQMGVDITHDSMRGAVYYGIRFVP
jgi:hypothetical protein